MEKSGRSKEVAWEGKVTGPGAQGHHLHRTAPRKAGWQGLWGCCSVVAPAWSLAGGQVGKRPREREVLTSWVFQIRAPSTREPLATLLWTSSSACLQLCLSISAVSSLCSHPGTEEARGHDRQLLAAPGSSWQLLAAPGKRRKAMTQGHRLERKLYPPCRYHKVKKSEKGRTWKESRKGDQRWP